jgi:hypothetical protein
MTVLAIGAIFLTTLTLSAFTLLDALQPRARKVEKRIF